MTIHLVTFSDESMGRSRSLCTESAIKHGVGPVSYVRAEDLSDWEQRRNVRGLGCWSWKPRIINAAMNAPNNFVRLHDGDYLIYADAGIEFINNVHYIIDRMDQDIFLFGNNWQHVHWCKADVIKAITPDWFERGLPVFNKQVQASVIFFRVSDYSRRFVKEWLDWCLFEGGRLIDDSPSRTPNHPQFQENRHDQSILTTLAYREGLRLHWWPAVYNRFSGPEFVYEKGEYVDTYPPLFHHHRLRNDQWPSS